MEILFGSNNEHKFKEMKEKIEQLGLKVYLIFPKSLTQEEISVAETGITLEENAYIKAKYFWEKFRIPCFSDDTGLEVDVLSGLPGVYSARFSGEEGNAKANRAKLLKMLEGVPEDKRMARFRTVICYINDSEVEFFEGICEGSIINEERGNFGFGYDSIFVPKGYSLTFAEIPLQEKNRISHRAKALEKFLNYLKAQIPSS